MKPDLVFRELLDARDVAAHLQLRRTIYAASPHLAFIAARGDGKLEVDDFDPWSRLYGLFVNDELVGTERVTPLPLQAAPHALAEVLAAHPGLAVAVTPDVELPMMRDSPDAEALARFVARCRGDQLRLVEASRFTVVADVQTRGVSALAAAAHIIESTLAIGLVCLGADIGLTGVRATNARAYERYGFHAIEGVTHRRGGPFDEPVTSLQVRLDTLRPALRERVDTLARELATSGVATRRAQ